MNTQMISIEVDEEVVDALGAHARPFVDLTPNDVLRRLLELESLEAGPPEAAAAPPSAVALPATTPSTTSPLAARSRAAARRSSGRAKKGTLLDEREYEIPILRALHEHGGRAAAREVVDRVGELVDHKLTDVDRERLKTGGVRWQARVQFARLRMKEQRLLKSDSPRGVWEISDDGEQRLAEEPSDAS